MNVSAVSAALDMCRAEMWRANGPTFAALSIVDLVERADMAEQTAGVRI